MFCPKCGTGGQRVDAYCKRCGEWLPDMSGFARRALWGQGIEPEQKIKTMLIWQSLSAALALFSALALFVRGSDAGGAKSIVYIVAGICLVITVMQLDNFFVSLRMRQNFKRSRSDAERAIEPLAEVNASLFNSPDATAELAATRGAGEATTQRLETEDARLSEQGK
jgi:hypothetical protein